MKLKYDEVDEKHYKVSKKEIKIIPWLVLLVAVFGILLGNQLANVEDTSITGMAVAGEDKSCVVCLSYSNFEKAQTGFVAHYIMWEGINGTYYTMSEQVIDDLIAPQVSGCNL